MKPSIDRNIYVLEVCSVKDHFFRFAYSDKRRGETAARGFLKAMREAPPDAVAAIYEDGVQVTIDGVAGNRIPVFMIRASEIGSVILREIDPSMMQRRERDDDEGEEWKNG